VAEDKYRLFSDAINKWMNDTDTFSRYPHLHQTNMHLKATTVSAPVDKWIAGEKDDV